jgi:hypothetical protein
MTNKAESEVHETMAAINRAWRENRPTQMQAYLHPGITMVLPKFSGTLIGADKIIASFVEFCTNARVLQHEESDEQTQLMGDVAFVNYRFNVLYERATYRERSIGRDIWAFRHSNGKWLAIWRTMVDLKEVRETKS